MNTLPPTRRAALMGLLILGLAATMPARAQELRKPPPDSLLQKLLRISGLSTGPGGLRDDDGAPGQLWVAAVDGSGAQPWTGDSRYRSPVFAPDGSLYALDGETLVHIAGPQAAVRSVHALPGTTKLVGFDPAVPVELVLLQRDAEAPLAVLGLHSRQVRSLKIDPAQPEVATLLGRIRGQARGQGELLVLVESQKRPGITGRDVVWSEVVVQRGRGAELVNVSRCDGIDCNQPALSADGRRVVFVRAAP